MKLRGVIITNRMNLREFFDFQEFWTKRREFLGSVQKDIFFESTRSEPYVLYSVVADWLAGNLETEMKCTNTRLTRTAVIVMGQIVNRRFSADCEQALAELPQSDALGLVALYEMMGRELSLDIEHVLPVFNVDYMNPDSDFWGVQGGRVLELQPLDRSLIPDTKELRNVLIVNASVNAAQEAVVKWGNREIHLAPGECCRAIFCGMSCLWLLPRSYGDLSFFMPRPRFAALRNTEGVPFKTTGSVISVAWGKGGFVVLTDDKQNPVVARHSRIDESSINYGLPKNDRPVHVVMRPDGREIFLLTSRRNLYHYPSEIDDVELLEKHVLMVEYVDDELVITK